MPETTQHPQLFENVFSKCDHDSCSWQLLENVFSKCDISKWRKNSPNILVDQMPLVSEIEQYDKLGFQVKVQKQKALRCDIYCSRKKPGKQLDDYLWHLLQRKRNWKAIWWISEDIYNSKETGLQFDEFRKNFVTSIVTEKKLGSKLINFAWIFWQIDARFPSPREICWKL